MTATVTGKQAGTDSTATTRRGPHFVHIVHGPRGRRRRAVPAHPRPGNPQPSNLVISGRRVFCGDTVTVAYAPTHYPAREVRTYVYDKDTGTGGYVTTYERAVRPAVTGVLRPLSASERRIIGPNGFAVEVPGPTMQRSGVSVQLGTRRELFCTEAFRADGATFQVAQPPW